MASASRTASITAGVTSSLLPGPMPATIILPISALIYNLIPKEARARHLFWLTVTLSSLKTELLTTAVRLAK